MKVAIFAILTQPQLDYLKNLANEQGIDCQFVCQGDESEITVGRRVTSTPLTGEMLQVAANAAGMSVMQVAAKAAEVGISTVEEALAHNDIPIAVKRALEDCL